MLGSIKLVFEWLLATIVAALPPEREIPNVPYGMGKKTILVRDGYKAQVLDTRLPQPSRRHRITEIRDLVQYGKTRMAGMEAQVTVFCSKGAFVMELDDQVELGREYVSYIPTFTEAAEAWLNRSKMEFNHLGLKKFIQDHIQHIQSSGKMTPESFLAAVSKFTLNTSMEYKANLDDGKEFGFTYKQGEAEGTARLPRQFTIMLPVYEGWSPCYPFTMRLDFTQEPGKPPVFTLEHGDTAEQLEKILDGMVESLKADLGPAWLVVRGIPAYANFLGAAIPGG